MFEKLIAMIQRFNWWYSYASCYVDREDEGKAAFGNCGGVVGGCMCCPYYTDLRKD